MIRKVSRKLEDISAHSTLYQTTKFPTDRNSKLLQPGKINTIKEFEFALGRIGNIVGKGENAGYQHFLLFPQCFQKATFSVSFKVGIVF